jgi:hypothetical protein
MARRGIPTAWNGLVFRSRLEAQWAYFFEQLNWPWNYEPIDLEGYIPDFVIAFPAGPLLVEVKSEFYVDELRKAAPKIEASSWAHEAIVVGTSPVMQGSGDLPTLGLLAERDHDVDGAYRWDRGIAHSCDACKGWALHHGGGSWRCRVCGEEDGNGLVLNVNPADLLAIWREATRIMRWHPPRLRRPQGAA